MLHGTFAEAQSVSTAFSLCNQEQLHNAVDGEVWFGRSGAQKQRRRASPFKSALIVPLRLRTF